LLATCWPIVPRRSAAISWPVCACCLRHRMPGPHAGTARHLLKEMVSTFSARAPRAVPKLEEGFADATGVLALPERYRKRLRTTNAQERLNEEIRRRERVIRIFPNRVSAEWLLGALLMEQDEVWSTGRVYLEMSEYWQWRAERERARSTAT
jgi:putative transposase